MGLMWPRLRRPSPSDRDADLYAYVIVTFSEPALTSIAAPGPCGPVSRLGVFWALPILGGVWDVKDGVVPGRRRCRRFAASEPRRRDIWTSGRASAARPRPRFPASMRTTQGELARCGPPRNNPRRAGSPHRLGPGCIIMPGAQLKACSAQLPHRPTFLPKGACALLAILRLGNPLIQITCIGNERGREGGYHIVGPHDRLDSERRTATDHLRHFLCR